MLTIVRDNSPEKSVLEIKKIGKLPDKTENPKKWNKNQTKKLENRDHAWWEIKKIRIKNAKIGIKNAKIGIKNQKIGIKIEKIGIKMQKLG